MQETTGEKFVVAQNRTSFLRRYGLFSDFVDDHAGEFWEALCPGLIPPFSLSDRYRYGVWSVTNTLVIWTGRMRIVKPQGFWLSTLVKWYGIYNDAFVCLSMTVSTEVICKTARQFCLKKRSIIGLSLTHHDDPKHRFSPIPENCPPRLMSSLRVKLSGYPEKAPDTWLLVSFGCLQPYGKSGHLQSESLCLSLSRGGCS